MQRAPLTNNNTTNQTNRREVPSSKGHSSTFNVPELSSAEMSTNFEEWIKMCTDNKVNVTNTWNFALIDYFHELTLFRDGDSINFQKASCTLDGCMKIYTSRVNSATTETGKLLTGLGDSSNNTTEGTEDTRQERRTRKKTNRSEVTLLKDFSTIAVKKFDLDFAVDPLFKKTSADFDEGGARGLLLNHLGVDQNCKLIFDASDATIEVDIEELDGEVSHLEEEGEDQSNIEKNQDISDDEEEDSDSDSNEKDDPMEEDPIEKEELINNQESEAMDIDESVTNEKTAVAEDISTPTLSKPSNETRVEMSRLIARLPQLDVIKEMNIVPSLKGFDFFSENDFEIPNLNDDDDEEEGEDDMPIVDPFQFDDYADAGYGDEDYGDVAYGMDNIDPFGFEENDNRDDDSTTEDGPPDMDSTEKSDTDPDFSSNIVPHGNKELLNYFDSSLSHNWAGPTHWKLKRVPTIKATEQDNEEKPKRKSKSAFQIPFDDEEVVDEEALFEPSPRKLTFSKDAISKMSKQLLPDDIHFSSKQLLQYFLKPMSSSIPTKKLVQTVAVEAPADQGSEEPDINFWAEKAKELPNDMDDGMGFGDDDIDYGDMGYGDDDIPLDSSMNQTTTGLGDSSYYNDTYDDPETSVLYGDPLITNHSLKKTKPLYVNYAKSVKRVDVKKLKDNLWKSLTLGTEERLLGSQKFTNVIHNLKKLYPPKIMRDISVPFCFICLLHLANEKDLSIQGLGAAPGQDADDFVLGDDVDWLNNEELLNEVTITQNEI